MTFYVDDSELAQSKNELAQSKYVDDSELAQSKNELAHSKNDILRRLQSSKKISPQTHRTR